MEKVQIIFVVLEIDKLDIITIIGTRPQFIKASIVSKALLDFGIREIVIDTWQHYDNNLQNKIIQSLPHPLNINREKESLINKCPKSLIDLIENVEIQIKKYIFKAQAILVYGDTNSTLVGALVAKKYSLKLIHIEAGERSFDNTMPEELNRISVDYLSDLLLCVNKNSFLNLNKNFSGIKKIVGDVMLDALIATKRNTKNISISNKTVKSIVDKKEDFIYFTLHRKINTESIEEVQKIINLFKKINQKIIWPAHPKMLKFIRQLEIPQNFKIVTPFNYQESIFLISKSNLVITDSGGLQKEAYWLQKKCITIREKTEWRETLIGGWNVLLDKVEEKLLLKFINKKVQISKWSLQNYGNGKAGVKVAKEIKKILN